MKTTKKPTPKKKTAVKATKKVVKKATKKVVKKGLPVRKAPSIVLEPVRQTRVLPDHKIVFAKCRRGSDVGTGGQSCESKRAYKLSRDGASLVQFKCIVCDHVWSVPVGGSINI